VEVYKILVWSLLLCAAVAIIGFGLIMIGFPKTGAIMLVVGVLGVCGSPFIAPLL
jgi:hypothetical protein